MKRLHAITLSLILPALLLTACMTNRNRENAVNTATDTTSSNGVVEIDQGAGSGNSDNKMGANLNIVCTIFPQYDWVRQILGEDIEEHELTLLLNNRVDLHSYQPSVDDIVRISTCDLFIFVGGDSDGWVANVLRNEHNPDMIVINLMDILGEDVKADESVLDDDDEHDHHDHDDDDDDDDDDDEHDHENDEHVWLSLKNAILFCNVITDALSSLNAEKDEVYRNNSSAYINRLSTLDANYHSALDMAPIRTLVFADRFPFRYLLDDYGINYYAAFSGCSAETEASFSTIISLSEKVNEYELHTIMVTESADRSIANTVISNTNEKNQQILMLDAMQSVTANDIQNGTTYILVMESNLEVLRAALGGDTRWSS